MFLLNILSEGTIKVLLVMPSTFREFSPLYSEAEHVGKLPCAPLILNNRSAISLSFLLEANTDISAISVYWTSVLRRVQVSFLFHPHSNRV